MTHTIWDGSFKVDSVRDSLEIFKFGYMARKMKPEELTDTIGYSAHLSLRKYNLTKSDNMSIR